MTEVIDESNFHEYFVDVRKHGPKKGQILARFSAVADLIEGQLKQDIIYLLSTMDNGGISAVKVMQKLGCATYEAAIDVCMEIAEDLKTGYSESDVEVGTHPDSNRPLPDLVSEKVEKKVYSYHYEQFFYTQAECVPKDDKHWDIIQINNLDEHLDKVDGGGEIRSKIVKTEES